MKRRPRIRARAAVVGGAAALGPLLGALVLGGACAGTTNPVGAGQSCSLATDCIVGLVCVPQDNGFSVCSDDLSKVAGKAPPEAGAADANARDGSGEGGGKEGGTGDATTAPDTGGGGPPDTGGGGPPDTGAD